MWQPIETAPKDGTRVLMHKAGVGKYSTFVGWWNCRDESWRDISHLFRDPSHWMPLPEPPEE